MPLLNLNIKIMKVKLFFFLLCAIIISACCGNEESEIISDNDKVLVEENEAIRQLIANVDNIAQPYVHHDIDTRSWRSFWRRIGRLFYNDACGYAWGMRKGLSWQLSLGCGAAASIFTAIAAKDANVYMTAERVTYQDATEAGILGNAHNQVVCAVAQENVQDLEADVELVIEANDKAANSATATATTRTDVGYVEPGGEAISREIQEEFNFAQMMAKVADLDEANEKAKTLIANTNYCDDLDLLKEYVSNIVEIGDKTQIRLFTRDLENNIDSAGLSLERASILKSMIAISENSYLLWRVEAK